MPNHFLFLSFPPFFLEGNAVRKRMTCLHISNDIHTCWGSSLSAEAPELLYDEEY